MITYTVKSGDTLAAIARQFLGSALRYPELAAYNGIANPNLIRIGQVIKIPDANELDYVTVTSQRLPEITSNEPLPGVFAMEPIEVTASRDWIMLATVAGILYYSLSTK